MVRELRTLAKPDPILRRSYEACPGPLGQVAPAAHSPRRPDRALTRTAGPERREIPGNSVGFWRLAYDGRREATEHELTLVHVVGATPQGDVLDRRRPLMSEGVDVMPLQETPLGASATVPFESTLPAVALSHRALDVRGDVA